MPCASSLAMSTAVDSCGVWPTNHMDLFSLLVPVLPAAGLPRACAPVAVPPAITDCKADVTRSVTSLATTCSRAESHAYCSPPFVP